MQSDHAVTLLELMEEDRGVALGDLELEVSEPVRRAAPKDRCELPTDALCRLVQGHLLRLCTKAPLGRCLAEAQALL